MIPINDIQSGDTLLLLGFGLSTEGTILHVDADTESFVYETDEGDRDTICLRTSEDNKVPGNVYDVHRHVATQTIVATFKSWQSGKYYEC